MLTGLRQDIRYGLRQLRQSPGFTLAAVLSLALGIGANTAIFQLVDAIRLKTLPVVEPQELAYIDFQQGSMRSGWSSTRSAHFTYALWDRIRAQQQAFSGLAAWSATRFNLAGGGEVRYAAGLYVSGDFFRTLGVSPLIGRTFTPQDDGASCAAAVVVSHAFWQREFGQDADVLSRTVSLDGHTFSVIGVTPASFFGVEVGNRYDVAVPLCADTLLAEDQRTRITMPTAWWLSMLGRLHSGWTVARANTYFKTLSPGLMQATLPPQYKPDAAKKYLANQLTVTEGGTGVSTLRRQYQQPLWLLMATTALVLLIACANLANLLLARAAAREREIAVRLAMGASRSRLVRQLLAESLLIAVWGAVAGGALAVVLSRGLIAFISTQGNPYFVGLTLDWRTLGFTAALAVSTCVLFGLAPAIRATQLSPAAAIRSSGRSLTAGRSRITLRRLLVAAQVSLSMVLLLGALLFVRSLHNLVTTEAGFQAEGVLAVQIDLGKAPVAKPRRQAVHDEITARIARLPGVRSAGQTWFTPLSGSRWDDSIGPDNTAAAASGKESFFNRASPGYFRTMGTALVAGRDFDDRDTLSAPKVAIVNQTFARKFFGGVNPVGRTFHIDADAGKPEPLIQIVGEVKDAKYYELREEFLPVAFLPVAQEAGPGRGLVDVVRTQGPPGRLIESIKAAVAEVSPAIELEFSSLSGQVDDSLLRERLMATLSGGFALLAALLATLGLYSVVAYTVVARRSEIGVRMALGADRTRVIRLVMAEAVVLLAGGLTAGLLISLWAGRAAESMLFGLKSHDPASMVAAIGLLSAITLLASFAPARRAAALHPMTALREE
jgi:predicted permease